MKRTKFSLAALASIAFSVFSSPSFAASDADLNPYLLAVAKTHLAPYMSRDLGKKVEFSTDPYERRQAKLNVSIPNATCDDYVPVLFKLGGLYKLEFMVDKFEENKSLMLEDYTKPMSTFVLFNLANDVLAAGIAVDPAIILCESTFAQMDNHPSIIKIKDYMENNLKPRIDRLRAEGRIK